MTPSPLIQGIPMLDINVAVLAVAALLGIVVSWWLGWHRGRTGHTCTPHAGPAPVEALAAVGDADWVPPQFPASAAPVHAGWVQPARPVWEAKRVTSLPVPGAEPANTTPVTVPAMQPSRVVLHPDAHHYGRHHRPAPGSPVERTQAVPGYRPKEKTS